jgi:hypothetical protein
VVHTFVPLVTPLCTHTRLMHVPVNTTMIFSVTVILNLILNLKVPVVDRHFFLFGDP